MAPPIDAAEAYARDVVAGVIPVGKLVRESCQRHLDDLKRYGTSPDAGTIYYNVAEAKSAIDFFPVALRHAKGEWGGGDCIYCGMTGMVRGQICEPCEGAGRRPPLAFELSKWQKYVIGSIFGWRRPDGTRRFRTAYIEVPRKNGKTTLAAGVAVLLAFFDGETGAEVYCAATKRDQAKIAFNLAKRMVSVSPLLAKRLNVLTNNINRADTDSKLEPLASDSNTLDGLNVHGCIVDELHMHRDSRVLDLMETATVARRQPLLFIITTAGQAGEEHNVCWQNHDYGEKVCARVVEDDSYFAYIACPDKDDDWRSRDTWAKANPGFNVSVREDQLAERCKRAQEMPAEKNKFLRYYLNVWTTRTSRWIAPEIWKRQEQRQREDDLIGRPCWGGLDLASTRDTCSLELWFPDEDQNGGDVLSYFWLPEGDLMKKVRSDRVRYDLWAEEGHLVLTPGDVTDYGFIEREILEEVLPTYRVMGIAFDEYNALQLATRLSDHGVEMVRFRQGYGRMAAPTREIQRLLGLGGIRHGGHPVLEWMALGCEVKVNADGEMKIVKPVGPAPGARAAQKVDGMVSLAMAIGAWMLQEPADDDDDAYLGADGFATL